MIAVALGFKLIQHKDNHGDGEKVFHSISTLQTKNRLLANAAQSEMIGVNSYHHQAVDPMASQAVYEKVEVAALAEDGTIESLESKNGLVWTFQFHPEFMNTQFSNRIFQSLEKRLRPNRKSYLCRRISGSL